MKYKHYAPVAPLILLDGTKEQVAEHVMAKCNDGDSIAIIAYEDDVDYIRAVLPKVDVYIFGSRDNETEQAKLLFKLLRDTDKKN